MKELKINILLIVIGIICCIPVILPYLSSGYFPTHDGEWAVVRAGEMFREIRDMQFPPRYSTVLNFGYGYPLFNFAYPFPYYVSTFLHVFQIGFIDSIFVSELYLARNFSVRDEHRTMRINPTLKSASINDVLRYPHLAT